MPGLQSTRGGKNLQRSTVAAGKGRRHSSSHAPRTSIPELQREGIRIETSKQVHRWRAMPLAACGRRRLRSHKDLPPYSMERQIKKKFQPPRFKPQQMRRGGSPPEKEEEAEGREPLEVLTAEEKKMIKSLHSKLGYPSIPDFARMLRLARARAPVWKYAQKDFKRSVCESQVKPKAARPAVPPRCLQAGEVVGVDVLYFPEFRVPERCSWQDYLQSMEPRPSTKTRKRSQT